MTFARFIRLRYNVADYILTTESEDRIGIVAALTRCLSEHGGFITEHAQFGTPSSERFYSRISFRIGDSQFQKLKESIQEISQTLTLTTRIIPAVAKMRTLIMVSKFDHCLNDLIYRWRNNSLPIDITGVVSNHEKSRDFIEAFGLKYHYIPVTGSTKNDAETQLRGLIKETNTDLIVLARYMQILSDTFCRDYSGQIINIHHSFLPSFKGARPYHRAYERGVKLIGATAHYVTADLDEGPIIDQDVVRVNHTMTPDKLITMGRDVESRVLAKAVKHHAEHRSFINGRKTVILP